MTFPVYFNLFGHRVHPHLVMELLAYTGGFQLYLATRKRFTRATVPLEQNLWLIVGCVFGALVGSRLLAFLELVDPGRHALSDWRTWLAGKTIVGGLLGGWAGVELVKRWQGIRHSTGDAFVFPLIVGMCIGRVGCFLTGLEDHTYGFHSSRPWAVDFGDGPRHPAQLYEIAMLIVTALLLAVRARLGSASNGELFRLFMGSYLAFRFAIDFLKPREVRVMGLSAIQIACVLGGGLCLWLLLRRPRKGEAIGADRATAASYG